MERPEDLSGVTYKVPVAFSTGDDADLLGYLSDLVKECVGDAETGLARRLEDMLSMWKRPTVVTHMYVTINGLDGRPLEVFTTIGKVGSSVSVMADGISRLASGWLQEGAPADKVLRHLEHMRAETAVTWPAAECMVFSVPDGMAKALRRWMLQHPVV